MTAPSNVLECMRQAGVFTKWLDDYRGRAGFSSCEMMHVMGAFVAGLDEDEQTAFDSARADMAHILEETARLGRGQ